MNGQTSITKVYKNKDLDEQEIDDMNLEQGEDYYTVSRDNSAYMADILKNNLDIEFTWETRMVPIQDIISGKRARTETIRGLTASVKEFGVLKPIAIMNTSVDGKFVLIDGLRRINGALRAGYTSISSDIIHFKDLRKAKRALPILELLFNHREPYSISEVWERARFLEKTMENFTPDRIEFLLQLNPGDYTKLVDVMTCNDITMAEVKDDLLQGKLSIEQAYKKLTKSRKDKTLEQRLLEQELSPEVMGDGSDELKDMANTISTEVGQAQQVDEEQQLSENEIAEILNTSDSVLGSLDDYSLEELDRTKDIRKTEYQKPGERHPVDPAIRKARLIRDNYHCQCCDIGGENNAFILDFHHVIPVSLGGPDTVDNAITGCLNCHQLIHLYANGELCVNFKGLEEKEVIKFKKIMAYGNNIITAALQKGKTREQLKKEQNPHTVGRKFPGVLKGQIQAAENVGVV